MDRQPRVQGPQAAGAIHSDFERGFIRAETIAYDDYVTLGGEAPRREAGKLRQEGKEYVTRTATCSTSSSTSDAMSASSTRTSRSVPVDVSVAEVVPVKR
jgi:hypothetical protein